MAKKKNNSKNAKSCGSFEQKENRSADRRQRSRGRRGPTDKQRLEESLAMTGDKVTPDQRKLEKMNAYNDPSWYAQNPQLLSDYASYPFGYPLGAQPFPESHYTWPLPGAAVAYFVPTIGVAQNEADPVNVAMRKLYSFVRYANSGAKNYDAPDLMLYVLAVDSARMYLEFLKRAYGVMMNYTAFNRYYPRALVKAMHIDYDDIEAHLADFRGYINQLAVKINQLWVPAGFSYFKRHEWLVQHIYVDSATSAKAQTYFFVPDGYYKFTVAGTPAVGSLQFARFSSNSALADIISFGNALIEPLITNEDIGIMSGDILKAYGTGGVLVTTGISEDYRVLPEYVPEVQSQFENLMFTGTVDSSLNVTQDTNIGGGFLKCNPRCVVRSIKMSDFVEPTSTNAKQVVADAMINPLQGARMLNLHMANPAPSDVIVATRDMFAVSDAPAEYIFSNGQLYSYSYFKALGSELFTALSLVYFNTSQLVRYFTFYSSASWYVNGSVTSDALAAISTGISDCYAGVSQFDWHPNIDVGVMQSTEGEFAWSQSHWPFMDLDNYTFVDTDNLANMHAVALLSQFTVPMIT